MEVCMKRATKILLLTAVVLMAMASCTTFKVSGLQVTKVMPNYVSVGEFDITVKVFELVGSSGGANLFNATADAMDSKIYDAIQREIQKYTGDAAVNVTIEYKAEFVDIIINGVTMSILAPATAHVSGVIVKYN